MSEAQVEGWKKSNKSVYTIKGGKNLYSLMHVGRMSPPDFHNGELPLFGFRGFKSEC